MDLLTLVTVCSIGFEPQAMQALILHESGGRPFSYRTQAGPLRSFPSMQAAIAAARKAQGKAPTIRVGLAGLETNLFGASAKPNEALFEPCPNVALASLRLQKLRARCAAQPRYRGHQTWCAVALWHGSWERMNADLADRVMTAVAIGGRSNPELPNGCDCPRIASVARSNCGQRAVSEASKRHENHAAVARGSGPIFVVRDGRAASVSAPAASSLFVPLSRN